LPPDQKRILRKEEDDAYKKIPKVKWQELPAIQKSIVAKERKLKIQKFQERVTAIALRMAEIKAKEKETRKAEAAGKQMSESGLGEKGRIGTAQDKPPTPKYTSQIGGMGGGGGGNSPSRPRRE